jgi:2-polyprenyl-3-methyl-5-hydroxy-6-metoxy-1,4-benzoquinol methylase
MAFALDPEGAEIRVLHALVDFAGTDVLEVGCGDGRLTRRFAGAARSVLALDPKADRIAAAAADPPTTLSGPACFRVADLTVDDPPAGAFDVAVLSWSI